MTVLANNLNQSITVTNSLLPVMEEFVWSINSGWLSQTAAGGRRLSHFKRQFLLTNQQNHSVTWHKAKIRAEYWHLEEVIKFKKSSYRWFSCSLLQTNYSMVSHVNTQRSVSHLVMAYRRSETWHGGWMSNWEKECKQAKYTDDMQTSEINLGKIREIKGEKEERT